MDPEFFERWPEEAAQHDFARREYALRDTRELIAPMQEDRTPALNHHGPAAAS